MGLDHEPGIDGSQAQAWSLSWLGDHRARKLPRWGRYKARMPAKDKGFDAKAGYDEVELRTVLTLRMDDGHTAQMAYGAVGGVTKASTAFDTENSLSTCSRPAGSRSSTTSRTMRRTSRSSRPWHGRIVSDQASAHAGADGALEHMPDTSAWRKRQRRAVEEVGWSGTVPSKSERQDHRQARFGGPCRTDVAPTGSRTDDPLRACGSSDRG